MTIGSAGRLSGFGGTPTRQTAPFGFTEEPAQIRERAQNRYPTATKARVAEARKRSLFPSSGLLVVYSVLM